MSDAFLTLIALIGFVALTLVSIRDRVGPLLVLSRCLDRIRGDFYCLELAYKAATHEWRTMRDSCHAKAKRTR